MKLNCPKCGIEGKTKQYVADFIVEDKVVAEVEGEGSSSKDNPKRDLFFHNKNYTILYDLYINSSKF